MDELPELVDQACALAGRLGFPLAREEAEGIGAGVPSGRVVMDDVTPVPPGSLAPSGDVKRELFFGDPRLLSVEVVLPDLRNSLLVGTRLGARTLHGATTTRVVTTLGD